MSLITESFYITGGTLHRDATCYIERQADTDLYNGLKEGRFCYVLTSRQMGKSSLMVRTATRLREEGIGVAVLDLTAIGQNLNPEQWYNGLLNQLGYRLDLEDELTDYSYEHKELGPLQRWMRTIREVVLPRCSGRVVIFIDEIDTVRSLPFSTDEFFAGIREFYNSRTEDQELERLTFCLLGVATPSDLIRDTRTTPFNIGQRIELSDFSETEAGPLAKGLLREERVARELLKRILYWTSGHPYLTQQLCKAVSEERDVSSAIDIDRLCEALFFSHRAQERDANLLFVRERILKSEADLAGLLELYRRVYSGKRVRDDETNLLVTVLRLSGIAKVESGYMRPRNRLYHRVFNREWVKANMPDAEMRRQRRAFWKGLLGTAAIALVILAAIGSLALNLKEQRDDNRRLLYGAQINLASQAWESGNVGRVLELLARQKPNPSQEDLRGFEWYYLWRLCHSDLITLDYENPIDTLTFSPDGAILAIGNRETIKLWDVAGRNEIATLKGHTGRIWRVAFSPDGKTLASGSEDKSIKLWDVANRSEIATLNGHTARIWCVAFSPDGKLLSSGSSDKTVRLWDIVKKQELASLVAHTDAVFSVAFSPDGKLLSSGSWDKTVKLWDVEKRIELSTLSGHTNIIYNVLFSPDGKTLASTSLDETIRLWKVASRQEEAVLKGHTAEIIPVLFSPDGKLLITAGSDNAVKLWDLATKRELTTMRGHTDTVFSMTITSDGRFLATGGWDRRVKLWDIASAYSPNYLDTHDGAVNSLAFSPDGKLLVTGSGSPIEEEPGFVKLWNVATKQELSSFQGHLYTVYSVAISSDGKTLISGSMDRTIKVWDMASASELFTFTGHTERVFSVAFSPDGRTIASGSRDKTARLWDLETKRELATLTGHTSDVRFVAFSPDGKTLATGGQDETVRLWDVATGRQKTTLMGHRTTIFSGSFSPDGRILSTGSIDGIIKLWLVGNGQELDTLKGHTGDVHSIVFSADGKRLATASKDNTVRIWDMLTKQELAVLKGHTGEVSSLAFSPDGKILATGSYDKMVRLWRANTDQEPELQNNR
jgi:WD40 repeat protein